MPRVRESRSFGYSLAVLAVVAATAVRWALGGVMGNRMPFITEYFAVIVATWYGGLGPSLLAAALGMLAGLALILPPLAANLMFDLTRIGVYLGVCSLTVAMGEALRIPRRQLEREVSDRKRAEESERRQAEQLRTTLASIGDAVIVTDAGGLVTSLNFIAEDLTGWTTDEAVGRPLAEVFPILDERSGEPMESPVATVLREGRVVLLSNHTILRTRDGSLRPIEDSAAPIRTADGRVRGVVLIFRDVSVRKRNEAALREQNERLRLALEAGRMGTWDWDLTTNQVVWSASLEAIHGLPAGAFPGTFEAYQRDIHPDDLARVLGSITRAVEQGMDHQLEYRLVWPDGSIHWVEARGRPITDASGRVVRMLGLCIDITDRKWAEVALRESEARFRQLADAMPQVVWTAQPDGNLDYFNRRWYELTGSPEGLVGDASWSPYLHPEDRHRCHERWYESVRSGMPYEIEYRFWDRERGEYRWFLGRALAVRDGTGQVLRWYGTGTDIDDKKRAEEALREADRRKSAFLATLAHELRNPLAPIRSALPVLLNPDGDGEAVRRDGAMIERQIRNITRLVDDLLDIARIDSGKIELHPEETDLAGIVRNARGDDTPVSRRARPPPRGRATVGAHTDPGGPDPDRAGDRQPTEQRRQVHRPGWSHLALSQPGSRRGGRPRPRRWDRDGRGDPPEGIRTIRPGRESGRPVAERPGHRLEFGPEPGGNARRQYRRPQRGPRSGQRVCGPAAALAAGADSGPANLGPIGVEQSGRPRAAPRPCGGRQPGRRGQPGQAPDAAAPSGCPRRL